MTDKILKLPDVMEATALSRSSIYAFISKDAFPKPVPLGARAVGWLKSWTFVKKVSRSGTSRSTGTGRTTSATR